MAVKKREKGLERKITSIDGQGKSGQEVQAKELVVGGCTGKL